MHNTGLDQHRIRQRDGQRPKHIQRICGGPFEINAARGKQRLRRRLQFPIAGSNKHHAAKRLFVRAVPPRKHRLFVRLLRDSETVHRFLRRKAQFHANPRRKIGIRIIGQNLPVYPVRAERIAQRTLHFGQSVKRPLGHFRIRILFNHHTIPDRSGIRLVHGQEKRIPQFVAGQRALRFHLCLAQRIARNVGHIDYGQGKEVHIAHAAIRGVLVRIAFLARAQGERNRLHAAPAGHMRAFAPARHKVYARFLHARTVPMVQEPRLADIGRIGTRAPSDRARPGSRVLEAAFGLQLLRATTLFFKFLRFLLLHCANALVERLFGQTTQNKQRIHARDAGAHLGETAEHVRQFFRIRYRFGSILRGATGFQGRKGRQRRPGGIEVRRRKRIIPKSVPVQFGQRVVRQSADGLAPAFFLVQEAVVRGERVKEQALRLINAASHVGKFGAAVVVLVVAIHAAQRLQRRFAVKMYALDAHHAQRRGIIQFVRGAFLARLVVGLDGVFVPRKGFVYLAKQKSPLGPELLVAHVGQTRCKRLRRLVESLLFNIQFSQRKAQLRLRPPGNIFPFQAAGKVLFRRFVGTHGHQGPGQPDPGLVLQAGFEGHDLAEFLFGAYVIFLIEIGLSYQYERVVHPFGARMFDQYIGAPVDGLPEIDVAARTGRGAENACVLHPVDGLLGGFHGLNAILVVLLRVIERIVIRGEIVVAPPDKGSASAPDRNEQERRCDKIDAGANGGRHGGKRMAEKEAKKPGRAAKHPARRSIRGSPAPYWCALSRATACPP